MATMTAAFAGLLAGQIDAIAWHARRMSCRLLEPGEDPLRACWCLDESRGGDGIVANKDIKLDRRSQRQDGRGSLGQHVAVLY